MYQKNIQLYPNVLKITVLISCLYKCNFFTFFFKNFLCTNFILLLKNTQQKRSLIQFYQINILRDYPRLDYLVVKDLIRPFYFILFKNKSLKSAFAMQEITNQNILKSCWFHPNFDIMKTSYFLKYK